MRLLRKAGDRLGICQATFSAGSGTADGGYAADCAEIPDVIWNGVLLAIRKQVCMGIGHGMKELTSPRHARALPLLSLHRPLLSTARASQSTQSNNSSSSPCGRIYVLTTLLQRASSLSVKV